MALSVRVKGGERLTINGAELFVSDSAQLVFITEVRVVLLERGNKVLGSGPEQPVTTNDRRQDA